MPKPYKIEVFNRDLSFKDFSVIENQPIYFDYLTLEKTKLKAPKLIVQKGDLLHVTDFDGSIVYQGIADDVKVQKNIVTISALPLLSLFDVAVTYDRTDLQNGALEDFIAKVITETYIANPDTLQNVSGLAVNVFTRTTNTKLNIKSNVHQFYDIITKALTMYGIVLDIKMLPQVKNIIVTVGVVNQNSVVIETHLKNTIEKNFVIGNSSGQVNKITLINKHDETQKIVYYLHPDGSVDTQSNDRISPVFLQLSMLKAIHF